MYDVGEGIVKGKGETAICGEASGNYGSCWSNVEVHLTKLTREER